MESKVWPDDYTMAEILEEEPWMGERLDPETIAALEAHGIRMPAWTPTIPGRDADPGRDGEARDS